MNTLESPRRAAFLDRDGVINEERGYAHRIEDFVLLPGVVEGLSTLQRAGYVLVVVTNQAGIAHGYYSIAQYEAFTRHMIEQLAAQGIHLAAVYHCPHHPGGLVNELKVDCECRKPRPGMLHRAAVELELDLARSVMIGDKRSDIEAGRAAGVRLVALVRSGHTVAASDAAAADVLLPGLQEAAKWLVEQDGVRNADPPAAPLPDQSHADVG